VHSLAVDPSDSRRLYATTGRGFYRFESKGASWKFAGSGVSRPYVVPLLVDAGGIIYTAGAAGPPPSWMAQGADAMFFVSGDGGHSFTPMPGADGIGRGMVMALLQSEQCRDDLFAVTTDGKLLRLRPREGEIAELTSNLPPAYAMAALP
jgi:hypothetical protein